MSVFVSVVSGTRNKLQLHPLTSVFFKTQLFSLESRISCFVFFLLFFFFLKGGLMIAMEFSPASPSSSSAPLLFLISCLMGSHVIMFNHRGNPLRSGCITQPLRSVKRCLPDLKRRGMELVGGRETTHTI